MLGGVYIRFPLINKPFNVVSYPLGGVDIFVSIYPNTSY